MKPKQSDLSTPLRTTCGEYGLAGVVVNTRLSPKCSCISFFNDKFGYEAKRMPIYGERLSKADKWDAEYDKFDEEEVEDLLVIFRLGT